MKRYALWVLSLMLALCIGLIWAQTETATAADADPVLDCCTAPGCDADCGCNAGTWDPDEGTGGCKGSACSGTGYCGATGTRCCLLAVRPYQNEINQEGKISRVVQGPGQEQLATGR